MKTKRDKEWFDNEEFWEELYPSMFPEERIAGTPEEVVKVLALTNPPGKAVLDLCCGPGRFSIELASRGYTVTGVDLTEFLLNKAWERAEKEGVQVEWIQSDMRDFVRPASYDLILSMFTSFGYFDDKNEDMQVLGNMLNSLRPGGVCVIEVMGKENLARIFGATASSMLPDGRLMVQRHEIFDDWTRIRNEWIIIEDGRTKTFSFHHTLYSGQELRDLLERAGFAEVKLYGNIDGDPFTHGAPRLVAVARKSGD